MGLFPKLHKTISVADIIAIISASKVEQIIPQVLQGRSFYSTLSSVLIVRFLVVFLSGVSTNLFNQSLPCGR